MANDNELLREYADSASEAAFSELVRRHVNMVYSAALREMGDAHVAEELTQAVFVELSRKAGSLTRHPALAGWLYTCVRWSAFNARRAEQSRNRRQLEYQTMSQLLSESPESAWQQLRPVLDDSLHEMGEKDRTAIVLRFFENLSLQEVGAQLGLSEDGARMRVERALKRLRSRLSKRGITSSSSALAAAIMVGAVMTAPSSLAAGIAMDAIGLGGGGSKAVFKSSVIAKKVILIGASSAVATATMFTLALFWFHPALLQRLHNWLVR